LSLLGLVVAQPVDAAQNPMPAPTSHLRHGVCVVSGISTVVPGTAKMVVAAHPTGALIVWLPGLNSKACAIATTHAAADRAAAMARDVMQARSVSNGMAYNCPLDDGARALMYFAYPHAAPPLVVSLGGCEFISQSGREDRATTSALRNELASLAPCAWRPYFSGRSGRC
jgi:hypothetical protein